MDDPEALWESASTCIGLAHKWKGHVDAQDEARYLKVYCEIQLREVQGSYPER
jgi:hypothetical protein